MRNFSFNSSFIGKSNHFPNQFFFDCLKNEQVESTPVKEWKDGKPEQMSLPSLEQTELIEMYLCLLLVFGLPAMNSLMNLRRRTRYCCQQYHYFWISFWNDITYMAHNTTVSLLQDTIHDTWIVYTCLASLRYNIFSVPFVLQYWCFHELEVTNFQIMNSFSLVLFISSVRNDWQKSLGARVSSSNKICWPNDLDFLANLVGDLIESSVYRSVTVSILWALQDSAIFIILPMTNKEKSSNFEQDVSKGAWYVIITDKWITLASIIHWLSMYAWSLVIQSRMALLWHGVHYLVTKHSGTLVHSPWKTYLANKPLELHASRDLLISFSFIEIRGFSASTSSESLGNFNEFLIIFFLLRSSEQPLILWKEVWVQIFT